MKSIRLISLILAVILALPALCACRHEDGEEEHSFGVWTIESAPGYDTKGVLVRRCSDPDCGKTERREIYASKDLSYTEKDGEIYLSGIGQCGDGFLYIASVTPDGKKLRGIGHSAFTDDKNVEFVYIEDGVEEICGYAFSGCSALRSARLPEKCELFEAGVFLSCTALESVSLPKNIKTLPESCFDGCGALETLDLPDGITILENSAFNLCTSLQTLALPEGLTAIGSNCFDGCAALETIESKLGDGRLPKTLRNVGSYAFADCASLRAISFYMPLDELGFCVFTGCTSLERVFLSKEIAHISAPNGKSPFIGANAQAKIVTNAGEKPDGWDEFFAVYDYIDAKDKDTEYLYLTVEYNSEVLS